MNTNKDKIVVARMLKEANLLKTIAGRKGTAIIGLGAALYSTMKAPKLIKGNRYKI